MLYIKNSDMTRVYAVHFDCSRDSYLRAVNAIKGTSYFISQEEKVFKKYNGNYSSAIAHKPLHSFKRMEWFLMSKESPEKYNLSEGCYWIVRVVDSGIVYLVHTNSFYKMYSEGYFDVRNVGGSNFNYLP